MAIVGARHGLSGRGGFDVGVKLSGDWVRFNQVIGSLDVVTMTAAAAAQRSFAEKYAKRVQYHIKTGGKEFGFKPTSKKYKSYKQQRGGPASRVLVWSKSFHDAVSVVDLSRGRVGVGIPKDAKREPYENEKSGILNISEYANILEHGSGGDMPPRPVFSKTFTQDLGGIKGLRTHIQWHLIRNLKVMGINAIKL